MQVADVIKALRVHVGMDAGRARWSPAEGVSVVCESG
jgi:hypothetical protein